MALIEYIIGGVLAMFIMFSIGDPKSRRGAPGREVAVRFAIVFSLYALIAYFGLSSGNSHLKALAIPSLVVLSVSTMVGMVAVIAWCGGKVTLLAIKNEIAGRWIFGLLATAAILIYIV